jgi:hypothetical protein
VMTRTCMEVPSRARQCTAIGPTGIVFFVGNTNGIVTMTATPTSTGQKASTYASIVATDQGNSERASMVNSFGVARIGGRSGWGSGGHIADQETTDG